MPTYLIVSDIHSNLAALNAVLAHAEGEYEHMICCGDIVGYGPDPEAVIDWVQESGCAVIRGNHDRVCADGTAAAEFNSSARIAVEWTRPKLSPDQLSFLQSLPQGPIDHKDAQICHGSPEDEDEYVSTPPDASQVLHRMKGPLTFFGHTHRQGGFVARRKMSDPEPHLEPKEGHLHALEVGYSSVFQLRRLEKSEEDAILPLDERYLYLLNPGAVGQPRDGDPRAAYCLYSPESRVVRFR